MNKKLGRRFEIRRWKFWVINVDGTNHTVHFGSMGTDGQRRSKKFNSTKEVWADVDRLIAQKIAKGYIEVFNR